MLHNAKKIFIDRFYILFLLITAFYLILFTFGNPFPRPLSEVNLMFFIFSGVFWILFVPFFFLAGFNSGSWIFTPFELMFPIIVSFLVYIIYIWMKLKTMGLTEDKTFVIKKLEFFVAYLWSVGTFAGFLGLWSAFRDDGIGFLILGGAHYILLLIALPFLLIIIYRQKIISKWFLIGISFESVLNSIYAIALFYVFFASGGLFASLSYRLVPGLLFLVELLPILLFYLHHRRNKSNK